MSKAEGGAKEKDGGKKKPKMKYFKAPKIFNAPTEEDPGVVKMSYHSSQTCRHPPRSSSPPLRKENWLPPEILKIPWRKMEEIDPWAEKVSASFIRFNNLTCVGKRTAEG